MLLLNKIANSVAYHKQMLIEQCGTPVNDLLQYTNLWLTRRQIICSAD